MNTVHQTLKNFWQAAKKMIKPIRIKLSQEADFFTFFIHYILSVIELLKIASTSNLAYDNKIDI